MLKLTFLTFKTYIKKNFVNLSEFLQNFANHSLTKFREFLREKRANFVKICAHEFLEGQNIDPNIQYTILNEKDWSFII